MLTIKKVLKSRTVWTVVVLFLLGGVNSVKGYFPPTYYTLMSGILSAFAIFFRADARQ